MLLRSMNSRNLYPRSLRAMNSRPSGEDMTWYAKRMAGRYSMPAADCQGRRGLEPRNERSRPPSIGPPRIAEVTLQQRLLAANARGERGREQDDERPAQRAGEDQRRPGAGEPCA